MKNLILLGIVAAMVLLMAQFPHTMINPGDLIQGHQSLKNTCFSCHEPFKGISNEKCISCHKLSEIGIDTMNRSDTASQILFHQSLSEQQCTACHTDHNGINPTVVMGSFEHEMLLKKVVNNCVGCHQKPADNLHLQLTPTCKSCHNTDGWKSGVVFDHDMLPAVSKNNCTSCHQSPADSFHQSIKDNCSKCHHTSKWLPSTFNHTSYFVLDRDHNATCITCHANNDFTKYTCYGCHEHSKRNILAEHNEEGIYNISDCVSCHKSSDEHEIGKGAEKGGKGNHDGKRDHDDDDD